MATASAISLASPSRLDYLRDLGVDHAVAPAVLSEPRPRRRLRHLRLRRHQFRLRHDADFRRFMQEAKRRDLRVITELVINHTSDQHDWFKRAKRSAAGTERARLVRLERHRPEILGHPHHLHRHREVELDLGRRSERLLLAPLLLAPAGPELRQSARSKAPCCR